MIFWIGLFVDVTTETGLLDLLRVLISPDTDAENAVEVNDNTAMVARIRNWYIEKMVK